MKKHNTLFTQKFIGISLIIISVFYIILALGGSTIEECDITPVLLIAPLGFIALFTKESIM